MKRDRLIRRIAGRAPSLLLAGSVAVASACSDSATEPATLGEMLAKIDGSFDSAASYDDRLDRLTGTCRNTRQDLADIAVVTVEAIESRGGNTSIAAVLNGMASSIPDGVQAIDCAEVAAAWATLQLGTG